MKKTANLVIIIFILMITVSCDQKNIITTATTLVEAEIADNRYAVVLSPNLFNANTGFVSLCPITNTKRGFGFEVDIPEDEISIQGKNESFYMTGVILTHQLKNLNARSRRLKIVGTMPEEIVESCLDYISTYLS